jgi:hypothetical protein
VSPVGAEQLEKAGVAGSRVIQPELEERSCRRR